MNYFELPRITSLSNLSEGESGTIIQVRGKPEEHRSMCCMGLAIGRSIYICDTEKDAEGPSLMVKSGDRIAMLEKKLAKNIKVKVTR